MPNLGATEIIIIAVVILVLFGAKKMPDAARSLGRSMRIFKAETKSLRDDDDDDKKSSSQSEKHSANTQSEQEHPSAESQQLPSSKDQPVVDGKVVNRDQAHQTH